MFEKLVHFVFIAFGVVLLLTPIGMADDPSLIGWWKLDESSGTVAHDSSGNGHNGTLKGGPTWVLGKVDGALLFDGVDDYVEIGSVGISGMDTRTVVAWVRASGTQIAADAGIFGFIPDGTYEGTYFDLEVDKDGNYVGNIRGYSWIFAPVDTDWHHFGVTYEDQQALMYYDGRLIDEDEGEIGTLDQVRIGANLSRSAYFPGMIDDFRIYNRVLTDTEIMAVIAGTDLGQATDPSPADEAKNAPYEGILKWTPSDAAVAHDVYCGTTADLVRNASRTDPMDVLVSQGQAGATFTPDDRLEFGRTYYWRVDEVTGSAAGSIVKGRLWNFTTEPYSYPIESIVATCDAPSPEDQGPDNVVNGSGLNEDDQHSARTIDMWSVDFSDANTPIELQLEFDRVYKLDEMYVWNHNFEFESLLGLGAKDVTVEYSVDGTDWAVLGDVELAQAPGAADYVYNSVISLEGVAAKFVRLVIRSAWGISNEVGLSEIRVTYVPAFARELDPADGAVDVAPEAVLTWRTGRDAISHNVYLGTAPDALVQVGTVAVTSYTPPAPLYLDTTYYWRVDEVNEAEAMPVWRGDLWSFTTQTCLVVDDFEAYIDDADAGQTIWEVWIDGWVEEGGEPDNGGSVVGHSTSPFAEREIVHGREQSMPLFFENTSASADSEADLTLSPAQDWTASGIGTLSLWFYGPEGNTGQLYVKINDTKVAYSGASTDIATAQWKRWTIDLSTVGANLSQVATLSIGVQGAGSGVLYIDDVQLCP